VTEIAVPDARPTRGPARVGQATAVEQSRAVAEVQAAVLVAMQYPRDVAAATLAMRDACQNPRLAGRAFFAFPRGGERVAGPSVYLARELAGMWGNVTYGVAEMLRDDEHKQSEMQAYAWDLERNVRVSSTFIVPHIRDTKKGPKPITEMRDIYENNANAGARRVREAIFSVLPLWFVDEAQEIAAKTNEHGGGKPLQQRVADAVAAFERLGVSPDQMADRIGRAASRWTGQDLAQLQTLYGSIQRGELRVEEEFPRGDPGVSRPPAPADPGTGPAPVPPAPGPDAEPADPMADRRRAERAMFAELGSIKVTARDDRLNLCTDIVGRPINTTDDLTSEDIELVTTAARNIGYTTDEEKRDERIADHVLAGARARAAEPL